MKPLFYNIEAENSILVKYQIFSIGNTFPSSPGAAAASRMYVDAVGKLGRQAQQGTWGGCADIGNILLVTRCFDPYIYFSRLSDPYIYSLTVGQGTTEYTH